MAGWKYSVTEFSDLLRARRRCCEGELSGWLGGMFKKEACRVCTCNIMCTHDDGFVKKRNMSRYTMMNGDRRGMMRWR